MGKKVTLINADSSSNLRCGREESVFRLIADQHFKDKLVLA